MVATASGNMAATALDNDLVRHLDDDNAIFVRSDANGNASWQACREATCPAAFAPCTCVRQFDGSRALRSGGPVCLLDNMVCMNSVTKIMVIEFMNNLNKAGDVW